MEIEKAIQEHEKGNLTFAQVQKKSSQSFDVKKNSQVAHHEYVSYLNQYNKLIEDSQILYKDSLSKIQDMDEERVRNIRKWLSLFFISFSDWGDLIKEKIDEWSNSVQLLNPQADTKLFIDDNRTTKEFYKKKEFVSYDYSQKIIQKKKERLASEDIQDDLIDTGRKQSFESTSSKNSGRKSFNKTEEASINEIGSDLISLESNDEQKDDKEETNQYDENKAYVIQALDRIFEGENLSNNEQLKVFGLLHESYISIIFARYLKNFKSPRKL